MMGPMDPVPASVLIIERQPLMRMALCNAIAAGPDLKVAEVDVNDSQILVIPGLDDVLLVPNQLDLILFSLGPRGGRDLYVLATLKQFRPDVPILVLIDNEMDGQERAAREAGAQVVVAKTASRSEIIQTLREMRSTSLLHHYSNFPEQEVDEKTPHQ
jgi:DNA-binding NarL/FixJ family response regulator